MIKTSLLGDSPQVTLGPRCAGQIEYYKLSNVDYERRFLPMLVTGAYGIFFTLDNETAREQRVIGACNMLFAVICSALIGWHVIIAKPKKKTRCQTPCLLV